MISVKGYRADRELEAEREPLLDLNTEHTLRKSADSACVRACVYLTVVSCRGEWTGLVGQAGVC